jgi:hypothetical protein
MTDTGGQSWQTTVEGIVVASGIFFGRRPRIGPLRAGTGAGRFQHSEWTALLGRFVQAGRVDYTTMRRVRRLVEMYLGRLASQDPESFIDADDQLAFYINAYNAIAIHQVLLHYPVKSIRNVPWAFLRPYPIGRHNLSLHTLHSTFLRSFADPRVHAALSCAAIDFPPLHSEAYIGTTLQSSLDAAMRRFLNDDQSGLRYNSTTHTVVLPPILRWFGGDFVKPSAMPGAVHLVDGWLQPQRVLDALQPWLPPSFLQLHQQQPYVQYADFNWQLNDQHKKELYKS